MYWRNFAKVCILEIDCVVTALGMLNAHSNELPSAFGLTYVTPVKVTSGVLPCVDTVHRYLRSG